MTELNQEELSRILGSKMKPINAGRFGNFESLRTVAEVLKAREELARSNDPDDPDATRRDPSD